MTRFLFSKALVSVSLAMGALCASGCSSDPTITREPVASGTVSLPLSTVANGHTYRLSSASIYLYGPSTYTFLSSSDDPLETQISATLQTGIYTANLYAWTLERDDGTGGFAPVPATLVSSSYVPFSILNGTTTTISYRFQTDGVVVTVGSGKLNVNVAVDEVSAVCTPFGADCRPGTWCAPPGLTGAPLACVPEGAIAVGQPCLTPTDCVANASCFDLGQGPICAELCPSSGSACASGAICHPAGAGYGICSSGDAGSPLAPG